jgi:predicted Zn-dependent peptidase
MNDEQPNSLDLIFRTARVARSREHGRAEGRAKLFTSFRMTFASLAFSNPDEFPPTERRERQIMTRFQITPQDFAACLSMASTDY